MAHPHPRNEDPRESGIEMRLVFSRLENASVQQIVWRHEEPKTLTDLDELEVVALLTSHRTAHRGLTEFFRRQERSDELRDGCDTDHGEKIVPAIGIGLAAEKKPIGSLHVLCANEPPDRCVIGRYWRSVAKQSSYER